MPLIQSMYEKKLISWPQLHPSLQILRGFILFPTLIQEVCGEHALPDASPKWDPSLLQSQL